MGPASRGVSLEQAFSSYPAIPSSLPLGSRPIVFGQVLEEAA